MLAQPDFCDALIDLAEAQGIGVCLDTSGHGDGARLLAMARRPNVTGVLFDLKAIDDDVHVEYTGVSNALILENLALLAGDPDVLPKVVMRMPLVRGVNDTEQLIEGAAGLFAAHGLCRVCLLPYHTLGVSKARNVGREAATFEPPSDERLAEIRARFEGIGMTVEVLGEAGR
jgi:pyruvate formate lyase activating enzyme